MTNPDPKPDTVDVTVKLTRPPEGMEWQIREPVPQREYYAGKMVTIEAVLRPIVPATVMVGKLTADELRVAELLADAYIAFCQLDTYHPQETADMTNAIHSAQQIIMSRLAVRVHPDVFHRAALARKPEPLCRDCGYPEQAHATGEEGPLDGNVCRRFTLWGKPCPVMVCRINGLLFYGTCGNQLYCTHLDRRPCKHKDGEGHGGEHE